MRNNFSLSEKKSLSFKKIWQTILENMELNFMANDETKLIEFFDILKIENYGDTRFTGKAQLPGAKRKKKFSIFKFKDELIAFSAYCPHEGRDLTESAVVEDFVIRCPGHQWIFKLKDKDFVSYPVIEREGKMFLIFGEVKEKNTTISGPEVTSSESNSELESLKEEISYLNDSIQKKEQHLVKTLSDMDEMIIELDDKKTETDITRKELDKSLGFVNRVVHTMGEVLIVLGPKGTIDKLNEEFSTYFQYTDEECLGKSPDFLLDSEGLDLLKKNVKEESKNPILFDYFSQKTSMEIEIYLVNKSGVSNCFQVRSGVMVNPHGKKEGIVLIGSNIQKLKEAEKAMKEAQKKALDLAHRAGMAQLATGVLHNIGNKITKMSILLETLEEDLGDNIITNRAIMIKELFEEHSNNLGSFFESHDMGKKMVTYFPIFFKTAQEENNDSLGRIVSVNKSLAMIKTILKAQQKASKGGTFEEEHFLKEIIENQLTEFASAFEKHQIKIIKDFSADRICYIQKMKVDQIIENLLKNSIEAMNGINQSQREIQLMIIGEDDDHITLLIKDKGNGIEKENIDKIFNFGFTTKEEGHGFGLHSCHNFMTEMKGGMNAKSEGLGMGATIFLKFRTKPIK